MADRSLWHRLPETALVSAALFLASCGSNVERVPVVAFTEGVETDLEEVAPNDWRIADERVLPDSNDTRVIARGLDGVVDTFSYAQLTDSTATVASAENPDEERRYRRRSYFGPILLYGLIGNRLGAYRRGITPRANAYTSPRTYDRVQNTTGARLANSGRRTTVTRPAGGRSGYGRSGGSSGRSYGG